MNLTFYNINHANTTYIQVLAYIIIEQMKSSIIGVNIQSNVQCVTI